MAPAATRRFGERWSTTNWTSARRSDLRAEGVLIARRFQLQFRRGPRASRMWSVNSRLALRGFIFLGVGGEGVHSNVIVIIDTEHISVLRQPRNIGIWAIYSIIIGPVPVQMGRIFFEAASLKLTEGIEFPQSFPITAKTFTQHLIIVH